MATRTITLDPVTRIEGHLRVDVQVDDAQVSSAWSSAQMWRGIEVILKGRDPHDAWAYAQRFCGVCTTVHAISSIRSVEHALNIEVPLNAQCLRNLMMAQHSVQDHIVHFYHLAALDWVDLPSALKADPAKTAAVAQSISDWPTNNEPHFRQVRDRLSNFAKGGRLGIFSSGYWGHPAMRLSPEVNLLALAHYLQALDYQRRAAQAVAIPGGKNPHVQNLIVGGVASPITPDHMTALNLERLEAMRTLMHESRAFVEQVYYPDLLAIAQGYRDWFKLGAGTLNYLAVPEFPEDTRNTQFTLNGGVILDANVGEFRPVKGHRDEALISHTQESVARAWYKPSPPLQPWNGQTEPEYSEFQPEAKYTWCKAPRLAGKPMQVGPLAQLLVNYAAGEPRTRALVDEANHKLGIGLADYHSTMGRMLARGLRARLMAELSLHYLDRLIGNLAKGDRVYANHVPTPDGEFRGVGFHEAPRGALSHWVVIKDKKIANYQAVVPTTWNASPRDEQGVPGPYEAALIGNPVVNPEKPLEVLRTIHSFDPCIACAVHTIRPGQAHSTAVTVR